MTELYQVDNQSTQSVDGRGQVTRKDDGTIEAPKYLFERPMALKTYYEKTRADNINRIKLWSAIEGLISGRPPFDQAELDADGLSHYPNFNDLEAMSRYERSALGFWNLINQTETLVRFSIRLPPSQASADNDVEEWADIMSEHFDDIIREEWLDFITQMTTLSAQLVKFGLSPVIWQDERDWRWKTVELQRMNIPDQSLTDIEQLSYVFFDTPYSIQDLYSIYDQIKADDTNCHWNKDILGQIIITYANSAVKNNNVPVTSMMDFEHRVVNGDLGWGNIFSDTLILTSCFAKEYSKKISHLMFFPGTMPQNEFLFQCREQYQDMREAFILFTGSPGEFTIHANRGIGHKIFSGAQVLNHFNCAIISAGLFAGTPLIKNLATGGRDSEALRIIPGVPTNIGAAEFVQNSMGENISQLIATSNFVSQKLEQNAMNSSDIPGAPDQDVGSKSAPEVRLKAYKEFGVVKNAIALFYSKMDLVYRNMAIKMLHSKDPWPGFEEANEWKERCIADGVPPEMFAVGNVKSNKLPRHLKVFASRVAGDGSNAARILGLESISPVMGGASARGQFRYRREMVLAHMGRDYARKFVGDTQEPDESSGGASLAALENFAMKQGEPPTFSPDNEHRTHTVTHFHLGKETIDKVQQGQSDAIQASKVFEQLIPHTGQHIQFLAQDPLQAQFLTSIKASWTALQKYATSIKVQAEKEYKTQVEQQQKDQAATQQVMTDQERKDMQAQGEEKRKDFKVQSQNVRASEANQTRGEILKTKVEKEAENTQYKTTLEYKAKLAGQSAAKNESDPTKTDLSNVSAPALHSEISNLEGKTLAPFDYEPKQ